LAGVIDTNAYIIGENPNKDVDLQVGKNAKNNILLK
jgi:hypothetical protein